MKFNCIFANMFDRKDVKKGWYFDFGQGFKYYKIIMSADHSINAFIKVDDRIPEEYCLKDLQTIQLNIPVEYILRKKIKDFFQFEHKDDHKNSLKVKFIMSKCHSIQDIYFIEIPKMGNFISEKLFFEITEKVKEEKTRNIEYEVNQVFLNERIYIPNLEEEINNSKYVEIKELYISYDWMYRMAMHEFIKYI